VDPDGRAKSKACTTKDEADAELAKVTVGIADGTYVTPSKVTLREYATAWLGHQLHHRPSTAEQARSRLERHVLPALGDMPLPRVRRSDVQALVTALATRDEKPLAPATVKVVYTYLAAVMRSAVDDRLISHTPCSRIKLPEVTKKRVVPLTDDQVAAIAGQAGERYRAMVALGAATGMRSGELRGLTVDRLSPALHLLGRSVPDAVTLHVDRQLTAVRPGGVPVWGPPKTPASDRKLTIGPVAARELVQHLRTFGVGRDGLLFVTEAGLPMSRERARTVWAAATKGVQLRDRSGWHDLRHYNASLLIRAGLSPRAVADRLGHEDPSETLRTYSHLWPDDEDRARQAADAGLAKLARP
jgi:integrase